LQLISVELLAMLRPVTPLVMLVITFVSVQFWWLPTLIKNNPDASTQSRQGFFESFRQPTIRLRRLGSSLGSNASQSERASDGSTVSVTLADKTGEIVNLMVNSGINLKTDAETNARQFLHEQGQCIDIGQYPCLKLPSASTGVSANTSQACEDVCGPPNLDFSWFINGNRILDSDAQRHLASTAHNPGTALKLFLVFKSDLKVDAELVEYLRGLPLDTTQRQKLKRNILEQGIYKRKHLASADVNSLLSGMKFWDEDAEQNSNERNMLQERLQNQANELKMAPDPGNLKTSLTQSESTGASVSGEKWSSWQLLSRSGIFHGVNIKVDGIEPTTTGEPVALLPVYQRMADDVFTNKILLQPPVQAFQTTFESSSLSQMQAASMVVTTLGVSSASSSVIKTGFSLDLGFFSIGASSSHAESESESTEKQKKRTERLEHVSHEYYKKKFAFEPRAMISITADMLEPSEAFERMVTSGVNESALAEKITKMFGTHSCTRVTLGGVYSLQASYTSKMAKTEADLSARTTRAIEKMSGAAFAVAAAGQRSGGAASMSGGGGGQSTSQQVHGTGSREVHNFADQNDSIDLTEEWLGGQSGAGLNGFRDSLSTSFTSNWHVIDRHVPHCFGNWKMIRKASLRQQVRNLWFNRMNLPEEMRSSMEHDVDVDEILSRRCSAFECPSGYWPRAKGETRHGYTTEKCCEQRATLGSEESNNYGGGWTFVNVAGKSVLDENDLVRIKPGADTLPVYEIVVPFNEVLVKRVSDNWCDSWGKKTPYWVRPDGASMGVQADENYWYTYNNHNGHVWLRQTTDYLQAGICKNCWVHPGNGNEYDTHGTTIESLEADGSLVKVVFPTAKTMLKVGNLNAFYKQGGGCDASHDVRYRVYVRNTKFPQQPQKPQQEQDASTTATTTDVHRHTIYVRWGHRECPSGARKLYTGYVAGADYSHSGSGANTLCLHPHPTYLDHNSGNQNGALLYGTEYQNTGVADANPEHEGVCSVCAVLGATYTQWGRHTCPGDQRTEYKGYIMADHYTHQKSEFVCVDEARQVTRKSTASNHNGNLWYTTEYETGSLPSNVFLLNHEATCAQCTDANFSSTYVRWGHRDCSSTATKLYTGYVAGGAYNHGGSGANTLCLHPHPLYLESSPGNQNGALLYGTEYKNTGAVDANHDHEGVCSVCAVLGATYTQWGHYTCPVNQMTEYKGYIMANHYTHQKSKFVCVDEARQVTRKSTASTHHSNLWYTTEYETGGSLPSDIFLLNHEATCAQCTDPNFFSTYVRWGHKDCPSTATKLYTGYVAGALSAHSGSGANTLCLHPHPTYLTYHPGNQNGALLYGTEYQNTGAADANHDHEGVCSVCAVPGTTYTQWGRHTCPDDQRTEYKGYIMANHYTQHKSQFVCVDEARQSTHTSKPSHNSGNLWFTTEYETGSLPSDVFLGNGEAACAQCTISDF